MTKEQILEALSHVQDPDLKKDLVTLNMIQDLVVDGSKVKFTRRSPHGNAPWR